MANSWTVSVLFKWISKAAAPMKATASGISKIGDVAKASTAPVAGLNKAVDGIAKPAAAATKSADKMWYSFDRGITRTKALIRLKMPDIFRATGKAAVAAITGIGAYIGSINIARAISLPFIYAFIRSNAQQAESTLKAAQAAGINATAFQKLEYAFKGNNLEAGTLDTVMRSLNARMIQVQAKVKSAVAPFKALNLQVKDGNGHYKTADVLFGEIADKFAAMPNGARKAALAQMLFGQTGAQLIPLLNGGAKGLKDAGDEAERLGYVLTGKALTGAGLFNQKVDTLWKSIFGLKNSIWVELLPAAGKLVDRFQEIFNANREDILKGITKGLNWVNNNMPAILKGIGDFVKLLKDIIGIGAAVTNAVGSIGNVFDILAVIMVGKLAWGMIGLVAQIWGVNTALYAFPGTWIVAAIAAVVVAIYLMVRHWDTVKKWFMGFWGWLTKNWQFLPVIGPMIHAADLLIQNWDKVMAFFRSLGDTVNRVFKTMTSLWNGLPVGVRRFLAGAATAIIPGGAAFAPLAYASQTDSPRARPLDNNTPAGRATNHTGTLDLTVNTPANTKVTGISTSPGFDLGVGRGFQGPGF